MHLGQRKLNTISGSGSEDNLKWIFTDYERCGLCGCPFKDSDPYYHVDAKEIYTNIEGKSKIEIEERYHIKCFDNKHKKREELN